MTDNPLMHADFGRIFMLTVIAGGLTAGGISPAVATPARAESAGEAQPAASEQALMQSFVARLLARAAMIDLRMTKDPQQADQLIAAAYLRDASNLQPADVHLARLAMTAASEAGDWNLAATMTRRVLSLDNRDTSAQLRLIDLQVRIAELQGGGPDPNQPNLAAGTQVLESVLTQRGQGLDPSVRSRAAHALSLRRLAAGDEKGFIEALSSSLQLDASNKQAAATAVEYFLPRVQQPTPRIELLASLLSADPLNPQVHLTLAEEFSTGGAFRSALRFYRMGIMLADRTRTEVPGPVRADDALCRVRAGEGATVSKRLTDQLEAARRQQRQRQESLRAEGKVPPVEEPMARLGRELERARFVAAMVSQQTAIARASALELAEMALLESGPGRLAAMSEAAFVVGWSQADGTKLAALKTELQAAATAEPTGEMAISLRRVEAWQKISSGDVAGAKEQLASLASDPLAQLMVLQLELADEQSRQAVDEILTRKIAGMAQSLGASPMGAWAAGLARQRTGTDLPMPEQAAKLTAQASGIASWIDQVVEDPSRMVGLRAAIERSADPSGFTLVRSVGDELEMVIRLRNRMPVPLALGDGEPIDTRMLATLFFDPPVSLPRQSADGLIMVSPGTARATAAMEVLDIQRRLRLMPGEEIVIVVRPESGLAGWAGQHGRVSLADESSPRNQRLRLRLIRAFDLDGGVPVVGAMGQLADVESVDRPMLLLGAIPADLIAALRIAEGEALIATLLTVRAELLRVGKPGSYSPGDAREVMIALAQRYKTGDTLTRLAIALTMPSTQQAPTTSAFEQMLLPFDETDTLVGRAWLITRVHRPDATLAAWLEARPGVAPVINLLRPRWQQARGGLASLDREWTNMPVDAMIESRLAPGSGNPLSGPSSSGLPRELLPVATDPATSPNAPAAPSPPQQPLPPAPQ